MINIAIKLATSITYTADGSQTNFSVPFDYLRPSFVHVFVNDAEVSEGFTISNRMVMFDSAPAKDAVVRIYRNTPTTRLVSWADASILKAIDMTIAEVQQLHILEEASDWSKTNSIVLDEESGVWQGRKCRVSNVADPTEAQDVVTKNYLENTEDSFVQRMNAIKTQTEQFANTAGNSKDSAYKSAQSASVSAASAAESAKLAEGYKNIAETAKSDASLYAANAKTSADNAGASKEEAQSAATTASNFASDARNSAGEAKSYRDAASTYATNAKNYSENVNVFVPSVSSDGILSWTNKAGLPNPPSVNIKGKDGADGGVTVDDTLSDTSTNPVQNKVVKAALDNRAVLDDVNTFTSPNHFDDIYMADGLSSLKWYNGSPNFVVAYINSKKYTGEAATARKATQDGDGNVITSTYATKTELSSCVKSVNNVTPDENGNVSISISGGGGGGSNITVDTELSATSTNPVQNKVIYNALLNKVGTDIFSGFALMGATSTIAWRQGSQAIGSINATNYTGTAARATQDGAGNVITETYATKADINGVVKSVNGTKPDASGNVTISVSGGSNVTVDTTLSATSTNPIANKAVYNALNDKLDKTAPVYEATKATQDGYGNVITSTYARKIDLASYVKTVNNTAPDENGNVTIAVSSGGGVSTSESNTWTAQQNFHDLMLSREKYTTYVVNGTSDTPITSTMAYAVTGAFTLSLATLAGALSASQSSVFTAYFSANGDYPLTITNAGTLKYIGSASDVAITSAGMLLNILMTKDASGNLTSIVQASKLS